MTHFVFLNSLRDSRILWLSGLSWLASLGIAGNAVQAQAPTAVESSPAVPVTTLPKIAPAIAPSLAPAPVSAPAPTVTAPSVTAPEPESAVAPIAGESGAFIDRTDYSLGATQRTEPAATLAKPPLPGSNRYANAPVRVTPVQVGGLSWSGSELQWNAGRTSPIGQAYNTVQDYYNRTIRPFGRIGNGDLRLIFPLAIPAPITSLFGWRLHPISGDARLHTGTDIGAPMGTPVLAALTGRVIMADFFGGYGLAVALEHQSGSQQTLYAHLSEIFVKPGEIIKQGAVLGRVGSTGASTGPHLHFEFRQQTTEGWVAMDAGLALETAMAEFTKSLQVAQKPTTPTPVKAPEWSRSTRN